MSRTSVRVQGASKKTRWTLVRNDSALSSPSKLDGGVMPVNGQFHDSRAPTRPGYESYDGSGYGSGSPVSERTNSDNWNHAPAAITANFEDFNFSSAFDQRTSHPTERHVPVNQDAVGQHLLYETAMMDTHSFEILDLGEIDALKKEHERLNSRIDGLNRKLALETKVKSAAQNLQRLYSTKKGARPDTPQSPESPRRSRNSLLSGRVRSGSGSSQTGTTLHQAQDELAQSIKTVDELNESIKELLARREEVERRLLRHTAAVLAKQASRTPEQTAPALSNGIHDPHDMHGMYAPNEFDGIRDILQGMPANSLNKSKDIQWLQEEHNEQLSSMQNRLEALNSHMRDIISSSSQARGLTPEPEPSLHRTDDLSHNLENMFDSLEKRVISMEQMAHQHGQELQVAREESDEASHAIEEAQSKAAEQAEKAVEYETVLSGLWDIMASDNGALTPTLGSEDSDERRGSPITPLKENFSLQAFSARVQNLHNVASSAKLQQDILRRQIQQQRDLNGKADVAKDKEISDWQGKHQELTASHEVIQDELVKTTAAHAQAEREATETRDELAKVMSEFDQLKHSIEARTEELNGHRDNSGKLARRIQELEAEVIDFDQMRDDKEAAEERHIDLESEVARLRTELTIAQADLEGAYGTRAQRQKEAGMKAEEVETLKENHRQATDELISLRRRTTELEKELQEMMHDFQEMTRESLELEKERGQLEASIDELRERCETLETQLTDEKVRQMGAKSPGGAGAPENGREATSVMVMRQEFKRMMRESRAEGIRLLRVSFYRYIKNLEMKLSLTVVDIRPNKKSAVSSKARFVGCDKPMDRWPETLQVLQPGAMVFLPDLPLRLTSPQRLLPVPERGHHQLQRINERTNER